MSDERHC
jgi:hypothetical protein